MSARNPDSPESARKKQLHQKSLRYLGIMLAALLITLPVFFFIREIWQAILTLGTAPFMAAALGLGLLLAAGPVTILVSGLISLFLRIEACFAEPATPRSAKDWGFISIAALLSFSPALGTLYVPLRGLVTGTLAFRGPGQHYTLKTDPYGFWQAEAFWLMGAAALAYLATQYWYAKYRCVRRSEPPQVDCETQSER